MLRAMSTGAAARFAILLLALALPAGCGDATGPEARVMGIALPDAIQLDAVRDSVRLVAELVFDDGAREPLEGGYWAGDAGDAATLHADGWVWTKGEGEFDVTVVHGTWTATSQVVIRREGRILITFDDGWRSARDVAPTLSAAGLRASVAVITETVGWPAFLGLADLQALHDAGWAFVSHSVTHPDLTSLSDTELEAELVDSKAWLRARGLRLGNAFIVPLHGWGARERAAIRRHYAAARGATVDAHWPHFVAEWRPVDPYDITTLDASALLRRADGRGEIMAQVRDAIARGQLLDLMFHDILPEDRDEFDGLAQDLAEVAERVFTWADLYPVPED
jgi:hypothetical protein